MSALPELSRPLRLGRWTQDAGRLRSSSCFTCGPSALSPINIFRSYAADREPQHLEQLDRESFEQLVRYTAKDVEGLVAYSNCDREYEPKHWRFVNEFVFHVDLLELVCSHITNMDDTTNG